MRSCPARTATSSTAGVLATRKATSPRYGSLWPRSRKWASNSKASFQAHIVVEEEFGGNGALAMIRQGYKADAVLVAESTEMQIHPANRGAIWFRIEIEGLPRHMGRKHDGISAIDLSYKVIQALYEYEKLIIAEAPTTPVLSATPTPCR